MTTISHKATARKTGITRLCVAECSCGWKVGRGTFPAAYRAAEQHVAKKVLTDSQD